MKLLLVAQASVWRVEADFPAREVEVGERYQRPPLTLAEQMVRLKPDITYRDVESVRTKSF